MPTFPMNNQTPAAPAITTTTNNPTTNNPTTNNPTTNRARTSHPTSLVELDLSSLERAHHQLTTPPPALGGSNPRSIRAKAAVRAATKQRKDTGKATTAAGTTTAVSAQHAQELCADVAFFRKEAQSYMEAQNLEEALSNQLLYGMTLQHAIRHENSPAKKTAHQAQLHHTEQALKQLHTKLQSKMDYFHGCLDSGSEDEDEDSEDQDDADHGDSKTKNGKKGTKGSPPSHSVVAVAKRRLQCGDVVPVDAVAGGSITLQSLVGSDAIKQDIIDSIVEPFNHPLLFKMHRSFLFYGPPGTGKTMFAKAAANSMHHLSSELDVLFFAPTADALKDRHVGGTEKKITNYFRCVQQLADDHTMRTGTKTIGVIFMDEIDSLARSRDEEDSSGAQASATNTLLQMMDGFSRLPSVVVMAATNYPWQLDSAVLSRFQNKIYVRLPDMPTTVELIKHNLRHFYAHVLRIPPAQFTANHYSTLSSICGVDDSSLHVLAKSFCSQQVPYSPSNIRDACDQVFRKSARQAHQQDAFYPVLVATSCEAHAELTSTEKQVLGQLNHKCVSAATYTMLRTRFPELIAPSAPTSLSSDSSSSSGQPVEGSHHSHSHSHLPPPQARPEQLTVQGKTYVHCSLWKSQAHVHTKPEEHTVPKPKPKPNPTSKPRPATKPATSPPTDAHQKTTGPPPVTDVAVLVKCLTQLTAFHVYIDEAASSTADVHYALYKPFHVMYGKESYSVFQLCGVGVLTVADVVFISAFMSSPLALIQKWVGPLLSHTPSSLLMQRLANVYFKDTKTAAEAPFWTCSFVSAAHLSAQQSSIRGPPLVHTTAFHLSTFYTNEKALDLHRIYTHTKSGVKRFVLWMVGGVTAALVPPLTKQETRTRVSPALTATEERAILTAIHFHRPDTTTATREEHRHGVGDNINEFGSGSGSGSKQHTSQHISQPSPQVQFRYHRRTEPTAIGKPTTHHPPLASALSLHVDLELFADVLDPDTPDYVRPSSDPAEIRRLDSYWKQGQ